MNPISLSGGVFMRQTDYPTVKGHLDSADLFSFFRDKPDITDMGMVEYFVNSGFMPERSTSLTMNAERVYLNGHEFKYSHPLTEKEFYILEDMSGTDQAGRSGAKFKLKFNSKKYDNGWIIAPDPQSRFHLLITPDEIIQDGDGWIFTVQLKTSNRNESFFPKQLLTRNTRFFPISTIDTEYNQTYSSIPEFGGGKREFMSYVGTSGSQLHYTITREAAFGQVGKNDLFNYNQFLQGIETFQFKPGTLGWNLSYQTPEQKMAYNGDVTSMYRKVMGGAESAERQMRNDSVLNAWAPKVEMLAVKLLNQMIETDAFYGSGGTVNFDGRTDTKTTLGLFHQFMLGNTHNYNLNNISLEYFESIITSRLEGKMEYNPTMSGPTVVIKSGRGGIAAIQDLLLKLPASSGLLWTVDGIVQGIGKNGNAQLHFETPSFVSWRMRSGLATLRFEYEASLDPQTANDSINPIVPVNRGVSGLRLSSYIYIIEDLSAMTSGSNVKEMIYGPDWDVRKSVVVGKLDYPGLGNGGGVWQRSNNGPGFEVMFEQRHKAYWLVDPTKSLVIKPFNPKTGKPIFEY